MYMYMVILISCLVFFDLSSPLFFMGIQIPSSSSLNMGIMLIHLYRCMSINKQFL